MQYADLWQRKNLLLVLIPATGSTDRHADISTLWDHIADLTAHDTSCVMTSDDITGVRSPAIVIADRWGEIAFIAEAESASELPRLDAIIEWLGHVQGRCPECEGETR